MFIFWLKMHLYTVTLWNEELMAETGKPNLFYGRRWTKRKILNANKPEWIEQVITVNRMNIIYIWLKYHIRTLPLPFYKNPFHRREVSQLGTGCHARMLAVTLVTNKVKVQVWLEILLVTKERVRAVEGASSCCLIQAFINLAVVSA